jgi:hypothetical protein
MVVHLLATGALLSGWCAGVPIGNLYILHLFDEAVCTYCAAAARSVGLVARSERRVLGSVSF